jgi:hypothetical protein
MTTRMRAKQPNVRVDRAARIHATFAAPSLMRNTLPPLRSNELLYANQWMYPRQQACRKASAFLRLSGNALPELLGEPDEKSFGAADVAEPIRVFVLDYFADELRAALAEPGERLVDVVHGEHDA